MTGRTYHRFPYRTFFRWSFFFLFLALIPGAPWLWSIYWEDYEAQTIHDLNQSPSYRHDPGAAEAVTWPIDSWQPWVMIGAIILFLLYLPIWWWARPSRDPVRHD
jgi:hypothetical protein